MGILQSILNALSGQGASDEDEGDVLVSNTVPRKKNAVNKAVIQAITVNNRKVIKKEKNEHVRAVEDAEFSIVKLKKQIVSLPVLKNKDQLVYEGLSYRSVLTPQYDVFGNERSHYAIIDFGERRCGILVAEAFVCLKKHLQIRDKLLKNFEIVFEQTSLSSLIAEVNNAINQKIDDDGSSDVSAICDELISQAIDAGASDIHICCRSDPAFNSGSVLFRIDGMVHKQRKFDVVVCNQIAGFLFQESEPSSRKPGNFALTHRQINCVLKKEHKRESYKLRYQFVLAADGWDVIIRILPVSDKKKLSFSDLGYEDSQINVIELAVKRSIGLVAILGPTGSGKSTTLKVMMQFDPHRLEKKTYSIEDPPEYKIFGVSQIAAQDGNYAEILKDLLRADPDSVMVGETRDATTASVLADAILTGHKLYTTLHTSSAITAYTRLSRLGVDRNILADRQFVAVLIFQRLMPKLCSHCKKPILNSARITPEMRGALLHKFKLDLNSIYVANPEGCEHCNGGIKGSTVVAEVVVPDAALRRFILDGDDDAAENYWRMTRASRFDDSNMQGKTAFEHALYKMSKGILSPEDIENQFEPFQTYEPIRVEVDEF